MLVIASSSKSIARTFSSIGFGRKPISLKTSDFPVALSSTVTDIARNPVNAFLDSWKKRSRYAGFSKFSGFIRLTTAEKLRTIPRSISSARDFC